MVRRLCKVPHLLGGLLRSCPRQRLLVVPGARVSGSDDESRSSFRTALQHMGVSEVVTPAEHLVRRLNRVGIRAVNAYPASWSIDRTNANEATERMQAVAHAACPELGLSEDEFGLTSYNLLFDAAALKLASHESATFLSQSLAPGEILRVEIPSRTGRLFGMQSDLWLWLFLAQFPDPDRLEIGTVDDQGSWEPSSNDRMVDFASADCILDGRPQTSRLPRRSTLFLPAAVAGGSLVRKLLMRAVTVATAFYELPDPADCILGIDPQTKPSLSLPLTDLTMSKGSRTASQTDANWFVVEAFRALLIPRLLELQQSADALVSAIEPRTILLCDHTYPDTASVAIAGRRRGARLVLLPHASAPIHRRAWERYLPDAAVASWEAGAVRWRRAGVSDVRVNSQLAGLMPRTRWPSRRPRPLRILYVGTASNEFMYPAFRRDVFAMHQQGLLSPPEDLLDHVSIIIKPRPQWESDTWYSDYLSRSGAISLTREPIGRASAGIDIAVCHDVLTTGLHEAALRGVPSFLIADTPIPEHVPRGERSLPAVSVDEFWSVVRDSLSGSDNLECTRGMQARWFREQTRYDPFPISDPVRSMRVRLLLRRTTRNTVATWRDNAMHLVRTLAGGSGA